MKYIVRRGLIRRKVADETGAVVACINRGLSGTSLSCLSGTGPVELLVTHTPSIRQPWEAKIQHSYHAMIGSKSIAYAITGDTLSSAQRQLNVSTSFGKYILRRKSPAGFDVLRDGALVGQIYTGIWRRNFISISLMIPVEICCILYAFAVFLKEE